MAKALSHDEHNSVLNSYAVKDHLLHFSFFRPDHLLLTYTGHRHLLDISLTVKGRCCQLFAYQSSSGKQAKNQLWFVSQLCWVLLRPWDHIYHFKHILIDKSGHILLTPSKLSSPFIFGALKTHKLSGYGAHTNPRHGANKHNFVFNKQI
jgi:hypothetical protein